MWTILGTNSTQFMSVRGMQGNTQQGGGCLEIYIIPSMPYYPQTITIQFWHPIFGQTLSINVIITDCNGDDPTCHEYYYSEAHSVVSNEIITNASESHTLSLSTDINDTTDLILVIFNIGGQRISLEEFLYHDRSKGPLLAILTYWDSKGQLIDVVKVLK